MYLYSLNVKLYAQHVYTISITFVVLLFDQSYFVKELFWTCLKLLEKRTVKAHVLDTTYNFAANVCPERTFELPDRREGNI